MGEVGDCGPPRGPAATISSSGADLRDITSDTTPSGRPDVRKDGQQIVGVVAERAGRRAVGALPVPSAVVCHDGVLVGDQLRDEVPVSMVEPRCVDEHDRRARPGRLNEEVDAIEEDHRHPMLPFVSSYSDVVRFIRLVGSVVNESRNSHSV